MEFRRPLRIPENVPLSISSPPELKVGEQADISVKFEISQAIPGGQIFGVQIFGGRWNKGWFKDLLAKNIICRTPTKRIVPDKNSDIEKNLRSGELYFVSPGIKKNEAVCLILKKVTVQPFSLFNKFFILFIALPQRKTNIPTINSELRRRILSCCLTHLVGNAPDHLRVYAPSICKSKESAELLVRVEDRSGNLSGEEVSPVFRANVHRKNLKITVEKSGTLSNVFRIKGIKFGRNGIYRAEIEDDRRKVKGVSNPVFCTDRSDEKIFWGVIHGHTEHSDGFGSIDFYFKYMRDGCRLDFGAPGDHDHLFETSEKMWANTQKAVALYNAPGRFTTFLGYEWAKWRKNGDGDRNVYYLQDYQPMFRSDDVCYPTPARLFKVLKNKKSIIIPHHTACAGNWCDWKDHEPEKERLVEIYSEWGNSECSAYEGNIYGVKTGEVPVGFVQRALSLGWRVGFTGGGDDHISHTGDDTHKAGITAVYARENTRESIWEALWKRHCYATTGARIIADFKVGNFPMGSEISLAINPEFLKKRKLFIKVCGTSVIDKIEIVRNNEVVDRFHPGKMDVELCWEDRDDLREVNLPRNKWWQTSFTFYYLRVTQEDKEMVWVSPIWIS